jgi:murein DD-endopeptidase MepM/ murein hydrolase activator NlpD
MSNDKLAEQLAKLKETLAKWEKELDAYKKWAITNDGILSFSEMMEISSRMSDINDIKIRITQEEKAKGNQNSVCRSISDSVGHGAVNQTKDVQLVQKALNEKIVAGLVEDGACGPLTINAIMKFQKENFGWSDGRIDVGGQTANKLFTNSSKSENTINLLDHVKDKTNEIGDKIIDFLWGSEDDDFQKNTIGNIIGDEAKKLFDGSLSLPHQNVGKNSPNNSEDVKLIQKLLGLTPSGKYDNKLEKAILDFQTSIGLSVDGVIGRGGKTIITLISYQKALSDCPEISKDKGSKIQHPQPGAKFFSPFGMRKGFMVNGKYLADHLHPGIDCGTGLNTPVFAVSEGVVILSGINGGFGNCIKIDHGKDESGTQFTTVYGHLNSCSVSVGSKVSKGTLIGKEGSTGLSTATHLHFEVRINNKSVDPMPYLKGAKLFPKLV